MSSRCAIELPSVIFGGLISRNLPLFRKQEGDTCPYAPALGTVLRRFGPIARAELQADRLFAEFCQLGDRGVDRHAPLVVLPVVGAFRVERESPGGRRGVGEEGL